MTNIQFFTPEQVRPLTSVISNNLQDIMRTKKSEIMKSEEFKALFEKYKETEDYKNSVESIDKAIAFRNERFAFEDSIVELFKIKPEEVDRFIDLLRLKNTILKKYYSLDYKFDVTIPENEGCWVESLYNRTVSDEDLKEKYLSLETQGYRVFNMYYKHNDDVNGDSYYNMYNTVETIIVTMEACDESKVKELVNEKLADFIANPYVLKA